MSQSQPPKIASLMMHKALAELNIDSLKKCELEPVKGQTVSAVLLAVGSNYQAEKYLSKVRQDLAALGQTQLSTAFQNPDFTATTALPKPHYTNQCVYLNLNVPMTLEQLQQIFKQFECDCNRQRLTETQAPIKKVTMDIDILLIQIAIDKNSLSKNNNIKKSKWIIMADRYPFKAHEKVGVEELIAGAGIDRLYL